MKTKKQVTSQMVLRTILELQAFDKPTTYLAIAKKLKIKVTQVSHYMTKLYKAKALKRDKKTGSLIVK